MESKDWKLLKHSKVPRKLKDINSTYKPENEKFIESTLLCEGKL